MSPEIAKPMQEVLDALYEEGTVAEHGYVDRYQPFDLSPGQFLDFAAHDLEAGDSLRARVNAMGNIKRAVDCRIDTILLFWGLKRIQERMEFSTKVFLLKEMGIVTTNLLDQLNTFRNKVEHQYLEPDVKEVNTYRDAATLFLGYTKSFLKEDPAEADIDNINCHCESKEDDCKYGYGEYDQARFQLDRTARTIKIKWEKSEDSVASQVFEVKYSDEANYLYLIRLWYRSLDRFNKF